MGQRRKQFSAGILVLACLFALGCSSAGAEKKDAASTILPSAAQASGTTGPSRAWEPWDPALEKVKVRQAARHKAERHKAERHKAEDPKAGQEAPSDPAPTCDDPRVLVDRSHPLPRHYVPEDLVSLPDYGVPTLGGSALQLRGEAAEHLGRLSWAAAADGEELVVASAFRSYAHQKLTYERLRSIYGPGADAMSAEPGHSQHQLGTAVDFTNVAAAYQLQPSFGQTSAAAWLREHATAYGFVLAYPPGDDGTAYEFEPWHYRYIGTDNARRLQESGLTPQEFLVREGVLPDCPNNAKTAPDGGSSRGG